MAYGFYACRCPCRPCRLRRGSDSLPRPVMPTPPAVAEMSRSVYTQVDADQPSGIALRASVFKDGEQVLHVRARDEPERLDPVRVGQRHVVVALPRFDLDLVLGRLRPRPP